MAKKAAVKKPRNRAAQDATLINIRALKKDLAAIDMVVRNLAFVVTAHHRELFGPPRPSRKRR